MFVLLVTCVLWVAEDLLGTLPQRMSCRGCFVFHLFKEMRRKGDKLAGCCPISCRPVITVLCTPEPLCADSGVSVEISVRKSCKQNLSVLVKSALLLVVKSTRVALY